MATYTGIDDVTGNPYSFSLDGAELHADWEGDGPAITAKLVTAAGSVDVFEWVTDGQVCSGEGESNILMHLDYDVAEAFAFERPVMAPIKGFIPKALFAALDSEYSRLTGGA